MKFLCDRCKTRYSIADERVRGKILKIRCKNCANVISVREGMTDDEPVAAPERSALQDAFAKEMAPPPAAEPPPPSLEEEWYVSIDGAQEGPYSLVAAQAWVSSKRPTDDVHCWSEGFDDWLPVEKVSHFRGLRQKAVAPAPRGKPAAPAPRAHTPTQPAPEPEPEPKPLFAATMARLEAEVSKVEKLDKPEPAKAAAPKREASKVEPAPKREASKVEAAPKREASKVESAPVAAARPEASKPVKVELPALASKRNGLGEAKPVEPQAAPEVAAEPRGRAALPSPRPATPAKPAGAEPAPAIPAKPASPAPIPLSALAGTASGPARAEARPARPEPRPIVPEPRPAARAPIPAARFDTGEAPDDDSDGEALDDSALESIDGPGDKAAASAGTDGLEFDIGEVSRVVRLPDIAAMAAARAAAGRAPAVARASTRSTGGATAIGRGTGATSAIAMATSSSGDAIAPGELPPLSESALADAQPIGPVAAPRRNHVALWIVMAAALVLVAVVVIAVVASTSGGNGAPISTGGTGYENLGYTVDDPRRPHDLTPGSGTGATPGSGTGTHIIRHPGSNGVTPGSGTGSNPGSGTGSSGRVEVGADGQPILPLSGDDIVNVSSRNSIGTRRCYERALKDDPFLKVTKIMVSLKVDVAGVVTDVALDSHGGDKLGQCLIGAIRRWGFRRSTEGINTQFPLVFQQGF